jgi:translation initiation factor IF-1
MCISARCGNTYMDVERRTMKPNKKFELTVRDIEVIESALRAKAGRRGMAIAEGDVSVQLHAEMTEIQELLGRIHHQKVWYTPKEFVPGG